MILFCAKAKAPIESFIGYYGYPHHTWCRRCRKLVKLHHSTNKDRRVRHLHFLVSDKRTELLQQLKEDGFKMEVKNF